MAGVATTPSPTRTDAANMLQFSPCTASNEPIAPLPSAALSAIRRAKSRDRRADELNPVEAAPLLCAGLTTFHALRKSKARAGDLVAIQGLGGFGHLGIHDAMHMWVE